MTCSNACELGTRRECSLVAVGNLVCGVPTDRAHVRVAGTLHRPGACAEIGRCLVQGGLGGWVCEGKNGVSCESNAPSVERVEPSSPECQPGGKKRSIAPFFRHRSAAACIASFSGTITPRSILISSPTNAAAAVLAYLQTPPGGRGKEQAAPGRASALCLFRTRLHESDGGKTDAFAG